MAKLKVRGHHVFAAIAGLCLLSAAWFQAVPDGVWVQAIPHDTSAIKPGTRIDRNFRLVNLSLQPILVSTTSTCGCTTAELTENQLPPFRTMMIQAHVDTKSKRTGAHEEDLALVFRSGQKSWHQKASIEYAVR